MKLSTSIAVSNDKKFLSDSSQFVVPSLNARKINRSTNSTPLSTLLQSTMSTVVDLNCIAEVERKLSVCILVASQLNNEHLCRALSKLITDRAEIMKIYAKYDYDSVTHANGYRSLVKVIDHYADIIYEDMKKNRFERFSDDVVSMSVCLSVALHSALNISKKGQQSLFCPPGDESFFEMVFEASSQLYGHFGQHQSFYLAPSMKKILRNYITIVCLISSSFFNKFRVFSTKYCSNVFATYVLSVSAVFVKSLWHLSEGFFYRRFYTWLTSGFKPNRKKTILLPRQKMVVMEHSQIVFNERHDDDITKNEKSPTVRCRLLQNTRNNQNTQNVIVIHCHGAGFIAQTPDSHENYLRKWAQQLEGVPILSVDYSLSPENIYPAAIQDVLDVYLWLVSGDESVEKMIGFRPKKIVLCGDSAGAILVSSLLFVLNDLKEIKPILMPSSMVLFYTAASLSSALTPGRLLSMIDVFLALGPLMAILNAYFIGPEELIEHKCKNDRYVTCHTKKTPWYRREDRNERLKLIDKVASSRFASAKSYDKIGAFNNVKLSLLVGEFDPLIDDNIEMAKRWPGPKTLDIIPKLSHGFLYFATFSKECDEAAKLSFQRLKEAVEV